MGPGVFGRHDRLHEAIRPIHDRMPVLLPPDESETQLRGSFDDLIDFQERCFPDELIQMDRTTEPSAKHPASPTTALLLWWSALRRVTALLSV